MGLPVHSRVHLLGCIACAGLLWVSTGAPAQTRPARTHIRPALPALTPWEQAVQAREDFEKSQDARSKASFARVLDAFRAIYHDNPRDRHAADAVNAVAQLLAEQGRALHDEKSLHAAVAQYEFLRRQYPTTGLRWAALLAEAQIEDNDLHDHQAARPLYAELIEKAPRSTFAGEARVALAEEARAEHTSLPERQPQSPADGAATIEGAQSASAAPPTRSQVRADQVAQTDRDLRDNSPQRISGLKVAGETRARSTTLAAVTGIRHWSTATYTRVAIDLGGEITFQAARVPHPDRIYFDLHGAKLSPELAGKTFNVTDDGFLERIRAAQDSPGVTRVVLDVSQVADYSAFLLPNPYRLIIDIHGAKPASEEAKTSAAPTPHERNIDPVTDAPVPANAAVMASAAANDSGLPAMGITGNAARSAQESESHATSNPARGRGESQVPPPRTGLLAKATPARPVPNTVATRSAESDTEVADISHTPGLVEATPRPTSKPISAASTHSHHSRRQPAPPPADDASPARAAARTGDGETSLTRALGLGIGRIVIDAGHGGHDSGTLGVDGIEEKDVVLDVALRLGKLLHDRLGAEIIYTRSDDTFIPLETRTAIANKAQADLFLSIHANSSSDPTARGVETYYLNFTSDPSALETAARENAVSGESIHQLSSLVKKIALKDKIDESREFASDVEGSLFSGLERGNAGLKNRGVKKAPFVVLIGANMPSILAEISFVTNPRDAEQLREPAYRERVAESLFRGVEKYEQGLAGTHTSEQPTVRASLQ